MSKITKKDLAKFMLIGGVFNLMKKIVRLFVEAKAIKIYVQQTFKIDNLIQHLYVSLFIFLLQTLQYRAWCCKFSTKIRVILHEIQPLYIGICTINVYTYPSLFPGFDWPMYHRKLAQYQSGGIQSRGLLLWHHSWTLQELEFSEKYTRSKPPIWWFSTVLP